MTMSILSSMEMVWLRPIFAGELWGRSSLSGEADGEKKLSMDSMPWASLWPVSLTVMPVFLRGGVS